ncbi:MAG: terpene cyclase/mutase family protein [Planctomycetes bacterium]|nr:terpene cyclase/mutase family protein [Planctomycetota bacterium]
MPTPIHTFATALLLGATLDAQGIRTYPEGVDPAIEASVQRGVDYLLRTQQRDGSWSAATGRGVYPVAMTALAGMAMLSSGTTPTRGRNWRSVRRATEYLIGVANPDGLIAVRGVEAASMYGHGFATLFLSQVYGMEEDARRQRTLHRTLSRACGLICRAQSIDGGWYYTPDSRRDEGSVAITQIQALRACRNAGITVPKRTIDRAVAYVHALANRDGSISYSMHTRSGTPGVTAAASAVLYNSGSYDDPVETRARDYAFRHLPVNGSGNHHHYYGQYYLAQSLYLHRDTRWNDYYRKMSTWLVRRQQRDGSWMGDSVGEIYGTAIALTVLQLPYAMVPIYQR